ncbi:methyltransferase family protein [uncultured Devosia sp.]|uniref:methyltransferase family protein n=1 Tax=uncultured Devosia sp. TaxID=211434 RepID=UPI0035CA778D
MISAIRQSPHFLHVLDFGERIVLAALFGYMVWTFVLAWLNGGSITTTILLVSEGAALVFVLLRRFTNDMSFHPADWGLALVGSAAPLLVQPTGANGSAALLAFCSILMLVGLVVQLAAKLTLRRSFGAVAANRGVKVGGPYRLVRHPMYAGYLMTHIGFLLTNPSARNALAYGICFIAQIGRIIAEEKLLTADSKYRDFAARVRYRLVPGIF